MELVTVYLGLGSNLGQREDNLRQAVRLLPPQVHPRRASSIYETAPWGYLDQPDFLNCVLEAQTSLSPDKLLAGVKKLEAQMGREPGVRYGPRLVDVDILIYGDQVIQEPDLQVPHPRLHLRAFVLVPLADLAPHLAHPTLRSTIADLARQVEGQEGVRRWGPPFKLPQGAP